MIPAAGVWLMMLPIATVVLLVCVLPTVSPAAVIAVVAAACVRPTTAGTAAPSETTMFTVLPAGTVVLAAGV